MDIDTINAMSDHLRQIRSATSSWDDESLGDEDVYSACDEMCSICVTILTKLDDLLDEDEDGENSNEESGSESNGESVHSLIHFKPYYTKPGFV
jgi:hypothetical protein